jgi:hypothetical protein
MGTRTQGEWVKAKALPPSTPPPATTQAQGFNRGTYNGYGTLEARDKHLADVKRFEAQHVKLLKQGLADNSYLTDLDRGSLLTLSFVHYHYHQKSSLKLICYDYNSNWL